MCKRSRFLHPELKNLKKNNNGIKNAENPKFVHHWADVYALYEISNEYDECFAYSVTVPPSTFVCISWLWFSHHFSFTIDGKQSKLCLPLQHLAERFSRFNFSFIIFSNDFKPKYLPNSGDTVDFTELDDINRIAQPSQNS